jgi:hypothetical protein
MTDVALVVRADVSEEHIASIYRGDVPPKSQFFLLESHGVMSEKTTSFIVILS